MEWFAGQMVRALCFDPETLILTNDNTLVPMQRMEESIYNSFNNIEEETRLCCMKMR